MSAPGSDPSSGSEPQAAGAEPLGPVERHLLSRYQAALRYGPFVPLLLGLLALAVWFGLQTWLLLQEGSNLRNAHAGQQQAVDNATRLRGSLDAVAADTQRLADAGNPNARLLVEELRKRGVTINPDAAKPADAPASK